MGGQAGTATAPAGAGPGPRLRGFWGCRAKLKWRHAGSSALRAKGEVVDLVLVALEVVPRLGLVLHAPRLGLLVALCSAALHCPVLARHRLLSRSRMLTNLGPLCKGRGGRLSSDLRLALRSSWGVTLFNADDAAFAERGGAGVPRKARTVE